MSSRQGRTGEMLKGSTPTLILAVLAEAPGHGYAIARRIEALSEDALSLGDGSLYPALRALEQREFILGEWETPPAGAARRIYRITPAGVAELEERRDAWRGFSRAVDRVISGGRHVPEPA